MSGPEPAAMLEVPGAGGVGLRIEFHKLGNCYAHRFLAYDDAGDSVVLFESIDDESQSQWPCSPVLQELNLETLGEAGQQVAMLVGKAGDAHWSVVVKPSETEEGVGFIVEVACRLKSLPAWLGSSYLLGDEVKRLATAGCAGLKSRLGSFQLLALPVDQPHVTLCRLAAEHNHLKISAECENRVAFPTTVQWRYGLWVM